MKVREIISEILYPSGIKCILCDDEIFFDSRYCVCDKCELPANDNFCISCGRGIPDMSDFCDYCKERPCHFTSARAPLLYCESIHKVVYRLKYGGGKFLAKYFARIMADCFEDYGWNIDKVTFVPMHKKRLKKRGYNQAQLIASEFCKIVNLPLLDCLDRVFYTDNLAQMKRDEREEAIKGAIAFKEGVSCPNSVLLVDDVLTSGTTAGECSRILKKQGAQTVYVLTLATSQMKPILY